MPNVSFVGNKSEPKAQNNYANNKAERLSTAERLIAVTSQRSQALRAQVLPGVLLAPVQHSSGRVPPRRHVSVVPIRQLILSHFC